MLEALYYKSEGHEFDSSIRSLDLFKWPVFPAALWTARKVDNFTATSEPTA
jgi:hypothetical protein